jgi:hypothetical protein
VSDCRKIGDVIEALTYRAFRHPGAGDEAVLTADRIRGPGNEPWWPVSLDCGPMSPLAQAGLRTMMWCATPAMARCAFAERQRALRAAGYERVG